MEGISNQGARDIQAQGYHRDEFGHPNASYPGEHHVYVVVPVDPGWMTLGVESGALNVPDGDGPDMHPANYINLELGGAIAGANLLANRFSFTANVGFRGRTAGNKNAHPYGMGKFGLGISIFLSSPEDSERMFRVSINPLSGYFMAGNDARMENFSELDTGNWGSIGWRPSASAFWLDRQKGLGLLLKLDIDAINRGTYAIAKETDEVGVEEKPAASTDSVDMTFKRSGVIPSVELMWAPWFSRESYARGVAFYAEYEHNWHHYVYRDFSGDRDLRGTLGWGQILGGVRYSFGGFKGRSAENDAVYNLK